MQIATARGSTRESAKDPSWEEIYGLRVRRYRMDNIRCNCPLEYTRFAHEDRSRERIRSFFASAASAARSTPAFISSKSLLSPSTTFFTGV